MEKRLIWIALDKNDKIIATWYRECSQSFTAWRKAVRNIGAVKITNVIFR